MSYFANKPKEKGGLKTNKIIQVKTKSALYKIFESEINYIEAEERKVVIHMREGEEIEVHTKIGRMEEMLGTVFCRCRNSTLVNMNQVRMMTRYYFRMLNGEYVPISQTLYKQSQTAFQEYMDSVGK